jgi:hypothetical protein
MNYNDNISLYISTSYASFIITWAKLSVKEKAFGVIEAVGMWATRFFGLSKPCVSTRSVVHQGGISTA